MKKKKEPIEPILQSHLTAMGQRLKDIRTVLDLTQTAFAATFERKGCTISELENGKASNPNLNMFYTIAEVYNVNLDYLFLGRGTMFNTPPPKADEPPDDDRMRTTIDTIEDVFWFCKKSKFFKYGLLTNAKTLFSINKDTIMNSFDQPDEE